MEILNQDLRYLNMHNHTWISKEQVNKIGYFAANIEELILSSTELDDDTLIELARSCKKYKGNGTLTLVSNASMFLAALTWQRGA